MKCLLIGGTRFIGPPVVRYLQEGGHDVAVFHRGKSKLTKLQGVKEILGDRKEIKNYEKELHSFSPDVVIDMICLNESDAKSLTEAISPFAKRLVMISSCDVYRAYGLLIGKEEGPLEPVPLSEDAPLRKIRFPYRRKLDEGSYLDDYDKIPAEEWVMSHSTIAGTVLRLPMVHGPGDYQHRLQPYVRRADDGRSHIILEKTHAKWTTTRGYVENVAWAIALCAMDEKAAGKIFNVADELEYTEAAWATLVTEACGHKCELVLAHNDELPAEMKTEGNFRQDLLTSSKKIREELGFIEKIPPAEALRRTIEWERETTAEIDYQQEDSFLKTVL